MMQVAKKIGKTAVVSGVCDGFIGNRMLEQYLRQAMFLLEEGASPQQVDARAREVRHGDGPVPHGRPRRQRHRLDDPQAPLRRASRTSRYSRIADRLCELGRFGQKTGAGWYRYEPGARDAMPDPGGRRADRRAIAQEIGVTPRAIADDEIVERCVFALVNEGARMLEEGIAQRASDIDVVYLTGYGFPRYRGGPMFYADTLGLYNVVRAMRALRRDAARATPRSGSPRRCSPASPPRAAPFNG